MDLPRAHTPRRTRDRLFFTAGVVLTMAFAPPAHAQPEAKAGARAAATQGMTAFAEKRYADALDLFTRAESLVHAPTHLLMIGRAQVALGRLVRAREAYVALSRETLPPNAPAAFKAAQVEGAKELEALEARVPTIDVKVSDPSAKDLVITMDGEAVPPALVGIPHPVDPGTHVLVAKASGFTSDPRSVQVDEGARVAVVLDLRPAPGATGAATGVVTPAVPPGGAAADTAPSPDGRLRVAGFIGIGLGVAAVGFGAVFTGLGFGERSDADAAHDACAPSCVRGSPAANAVVELDESANTKQTIGLVGLIAGGALAATGVTLLVLSSRTEDARPRASIWVGPGSVGLAGRF